MDPAVRAPRFRRAYALAGGLILLGAGIVASLYQESVFRAQRARELAVQADILAASVTAALVFKDAKTAQEHVNALGANPEIAAVGVYEARGYLVAAFVREGTPALPPLMNDGATDDRTRGMRTAVPVVFEGERLGTVRIRAKEEPLARRLTRHLPMMLLAIMATLLFAFTVASQRTLREANAQLEARAFALARTNRLLETEMQERTKAEDALRQSQKMEAIGQLAGGVAHDFNNLLTIIQGNLHLLRPGNADDREAAQAYVDAANLAADRAGHLVRRLLTFSRPQPIMLRVVDLNVLAKGMRELIVHSVGDLVKVDWQLNATWMTRCDVNQVENVILNIAINARDAMPQGGTLTIETRDVTLTDVGHGNHGEPAEYVELRMRDTGGGMTEDVREKAFEPFFTTKPAGQGTGLGLSMAYKVVRQANGHLFIDSAPGRGTTVVMQLLRHVGRSERSETA